MSLDVVLPFYDRRERKSIHPPLAMFCNCRYAHLTVGRRQLIIKTYHGYMESREQETMAKSKRSRRSQQLLFGLLSLMVVVSMGLALFAVPLSTPVAPTATLAPISIASPTPVPSPTPVLTPVPTP